MGQTGLRPVRKARTGSVIRIEENIGARYPVRAKARVTKFDDGAFNFSPLLGGLIPVGTLIHEYAETERGCSFYTEMLIGTTLPLIGPFVNSLIRRFVASEDFLQAWIVTTSRKVERPSNSFPGSSSMPGVVAAPSNKPLKLTAEPVSATDPR